MVADDVKLLHSYAVRSIQYMHAAEHDMARRIGEVQEVQITLPNGFIGEFIRVRVRLDVNKKLTRFVSFTKGGKTEFYQVKYEKLPTFCFACGQLGHWHQECGTGEHDEDKLEWGPFLMAPRRGRGGGRGSGQGRGAEKDMGADTGVFRGRGRGGRFGGRDGRGGGRSGPWRDPRDQNMDWEEDYTDELNDGGEIDAITRKRGATDYKNNGQDVENGTGSVLALVGMIDGKEHSEQTGALGTPQKSLNKKKQRTEKGSGKDGYIQTNLISAASDPEADRTQ